MKGRFSTYDLICIITELQKLKGMRVQQVYDIDHKTYLIKLQAGEQKAVLCIESGIRIHTTSFEWPKSDAPNGFSMKMRKHIKNKRLEKLSQLGIDRIVDLQFGSGEAAYHVIVEIYDKGNIILTDHELKILYLLRPHTENETIKFSVREKYPADRGKGRVPPPSEEDLREIFAKADKNWNLKKILNPILAYGPAMLEHVLMQAGVSPFTKYKDFDSRDLSPILNAFKIAEEIIDEAYTPMKTNGYIIQKREKDDFYSNQEFHPKVFEQHKDQRWLELETFDFAVDEFFSNMESQKLELKIFQQEATAMKKLENVKQDHEKRLVDLEKLQEEDAALGELITRNREVVERAIMAVRQMLARQMSWPDIAQVVKEATQLDDPVASIIKNLKLNINHITLLLKNPYEDEEEDDSLKPSLVDINLDLSAFANAEKYYEKKKQAALKQKKTLESQVKAFKSAEKKTKATLKEVKTSASISKARKVFWFEKFFWFISSENYLVIGGRDMQQNELIVKRYLKSNDIYVHAGITGASSIVIKNPTSDPVPPKTLNEAGSMAMCYSTAWDMKVVSSAWWVHADQVSKTAPSGEYLSTGSFMVRGKKNFFPQSHLVMGFAFMFKLEDDSIQRHKDERKVRTFEDKDDGTAAEMPEEEVEIQLSDKDDSDDDGGKKEEFGVKNKEENEEEDDDENGFPDTEIIIKHSRKNVDVVVGSSENNKAVLKKEEELSEVEGTVFYLGDDEPVIVKHSAKPVDKKCGVTFERKEHGIKSAEINKSVQPKRGQKTKAKNKNRDRYKYLDEAERVFMQNILHATSDENKKKKLEKKEKKDKKKQKGVKRAPFEAKPVLMVGPKIPVEGKEAAGDDEEDAVKEEVVVTADVDMLDSLTGLPLPEDELLFAIPVIAPYNVLTNYKYKVKLTPGTGRRGKAAKTALNMFLNDRTAVPREKDLLKFVKDQDLARNFPGKVKITATQKAMIKRK